MTSRKQTEETMANVGQNILVVSIAVIGSILLQAGLNHIWPWEKRGGMDGFWGCRAEGLEANAVVDASPGQRAPGASANAAANIGRFVRRYGHHARLAADGQRRSAGGNGGDQIGNVGYGNICPGSIGDRDYRPTARAIATQLP